MANHATPITEGEGLPPQEFVSVHYDEKQKYYQQIETPTDERGLIDVDDLISTVKELVDPEYEWPKKLSVHHFYDPETWYPSMSRNGEAYNPRVFRNLPIHKGLVPRQFENLLHWATLPAPVPDREVMHYRVEAWKVAKGLFEKMRDQVVWERRAARRVLLLASNGTILKEEFDGEDLEGEDVMEDIYLANFRGIEQHYEQSQQIPPEFRLIDFDASGQDLITGLGKLVMPRSLQLVKKIAA